MKELISIVHPSGRLRGLRNRRFRRREAGVSDAASRSRRRPCEQRKKLRVEIGRLAVYSMLEQGIIPSVRVGGRWIITRHAYEQWERTCGTRSGTGLSPHTEVMVLN